MPGGKCEASRLPEGRSRKQTRQKLEKDDEQRSGERPDEQGRRRSHTASLRGPAQALRGRRRQRWQAMRNSLLATGPRAAGTVAGGAVRQDRDRSGSYRWQDAGSDDGSPRRRSRSGPRCVRARASRLVAAVRVWQGLRRRRLRCRRCCRSARRVRPGRRDGLRHDRRRLALDGCCADGRGFLSLRGRRHARASHDGGDNRGGRRDLLLDQRLRIGRRGVGLLQQLLGARVVGGARCRLNGEHAERNRAEENADAHAGMIRRARPPRHRSPGGSSSPHPGVPTPPSSAASGRGGRAGRPRRRPRPGCRPRASASHC
jgi:hypothetical protein